jgi:hypothetical protein
VGVIKVICPHACFPREFGNTPPHLRIQIPAPKSKKSSRSADPLPDISLPFSSPKTLGVAAKLLRLASPPTTRAHGRRPLLPRVARLNDLVAGGHRRGGGGGGVVGDPDRQQAAGHLRAAGEQLHDRPAAGGRGGEPEQRQVQRPRGARRPRLPPAGLRHLHAPASGAPARAPAAPPRGCRGGRVGRVPAPLGPPLLRLPRNPTRDPGTRPSSSFVSLKVTESMGLSIKQLIGRLFRLFHKHSVHSIALLFCSPRFEMDVYVRLWCLFLMWVGSHGLQCILLMPPLSICC